MLIGQMNVHGSEIFFEIAYVLRSGDGDDILALSEHPGKGQLRGRTADLLCDLPHGLGQMQIALEVFALEPGMVTPPVVLRNGILRLEPSSEETASHWAVGDKADAQLPARLQDIAFGIPGPERILSLQGGDRMNFAGAANSRGSGFRQPQESYFAFMNQIGHGAHRVLDGDR